MKTLSYHPVHATQAWAFFKYKPYWSSGMCSRSCCQDNVSSHKQLHCSFLKKEDLHTLNVGESLYNNIRRHDSTQTWHAHTHDHTWHENDLNTSWLCISFQLRKMCLRMPLITQINGKEQTQTQTWYQRVDIQQRAPQHNIVLKVIESISILSGLLEAWVESNCPKRVAGK